MAKVGAVKTNDIEKLRKSKLPIVEQCIGCKRTERNETCSAYYNPEVKWSAGNCPLASHVQTEEEIAAEKIRVGQQKQKKKTKK